MKFPFIFDEIKRVKCCKGDTCGPSTDDVTVWELVQLNHYDNV